jgi:hypothetical protein
MRMLQNSIGFPLKDATPLAIEMSQSMSGTTAQKQPTL